MQQIPKNTDIQPYTHTTTHTYIRAHTNFLTNQNITGVKILEKKARDKHKSKGGKERHTLERLVAKHQQLLSL